MNPTASASVVTAKSTGKIKQAVSMIGTAMAIVPPLQTVGGVLLWVSLPLAVMSVTEKLQEKGMERVLIFSQTLFAPGSISRMADIQKTYEVIACIEKGKDAEIAAASNLGEVIVGTAMLAGGKLEEADFDGLGASLVFVGSEAELQNVDPRLRERGVVKVL